MWVCLESLEDRNGGVWCENAVGKDESEREREMEECVIRKWLCDNIGNL